MPEAILPGSPLVANIPNAAFPTAGQGLVLDLNGKLPASLLPTTYRKTTAKTVNTTVTKTDLLNGEITIAANAMGASGMVRLTAWGDFLQNSGGAAAIPLWGIALGATDLLVMQASGAAFVASATRQAWRVVAEIMNLGATNSQLSSFALQLSASAGAGTVNAPFSTGEGYWTAVSSSAASNQMVIAQGVNPSTAVDTTSAQVLKLNVINGSASATYETKLLGALVEIV